MQNPIATVNIKVDINEQRVNDLFCNAVEGGSNYWCKKIRPLLETDNKRSYENYMLNGFKATIDEEIENGKGLLYKCTRDDIVEAIQIMSDKYPRHFKDFLDENDDAETGDVFLQLCLFKELVFG